MIDYPNQAFVEYLITGLQHGFDIGIDTYITTTFECRNNKTARDQPLLVSSLLEAETLKGYLIGPFASSPFDIYRINPLGIAEGKYSKKKRLIVDMSAPHDSPLGITSINDLIDKEKFSLTYVKIDDAIQTLQKLGKGSWLCKTDITDAFKQIPVLQSQWHLQGIKHLDQYFFYTRLVFGCRSSPKIFDTLASTIKWIAMNNYGLAHIFQLLDDFLAIDPPSSESEAYRTMAVLTMIFARLNIPLSAHKTVGPTHVLEYLGIILDALLMEARLPQDKIQRICNMLDSFLTKPNVTKRDLLSLLGHLNFASRVIVAGRSFISYLLALAKSVPEMYHRVYITDDCRSELTMWYKFLQQWNGRSFFLMNEAILASDFDLFTDASSTIGYGGFFKGHWFACSWPESVTLADDNLSMAFLELVPIVMAAVLWGSQWATHRIKFHCDNQATVAIINKGRSQSIAIMPLMRRLTLCAMENCFTLSADYLPGAQNSIADSLSRFQWDRFRQLAPHANQYPEACPDFTHLLF